LGDSSKGGHNIIRNNGIYNIFTSSTEDILAKNNFWGINNPDSVAASIYSGGGKDTPGRVYFLPFWNGSPGKSGGAQMALNDLNPLPRIYKLEQSYPNPMRKDATLAFSLPKSTYVGLKIYNVLGQEVCSLLDEYKQAGIYKIKWDGKNSKGAPVTAGVYMYYLKTNDYQCAKKVTVIR